MQNLSKALYKKLYLVRQSEEKIRELYHEDEMKTPTHLSVGEEAIVVGVCHALKSDDQVFGTYRSHGLYLAKTQETNKFFAELYGKVTGLGKGRVGSMHLSAPDKGFMGTSAIVASIIPVAVGAAFVNKRKNNGKIVAVFFGDGAIDEGAFWESLNVACLYQLPILFVYEDNNLAVHTSIEKRHGYNSITEIVSEFKCSVYTTFFSTDVEDVYFTIFKILTSMQKSLKPAFIHLKYYRYYEHVGINTDFDMGYRSKKEFEKWSELDPIKLQQKKLLKLGISKKEISNIEKEIDVQIEKSIKNAKKAPKADMSELIEDIY